MSRIIIISNRLPVTIDKKDGELHYYPSAGGLATGLNSLDQNLERLWIGWPGKEINDKREQQTIEENLEKEGLIPVFLSQEEIELYYEGFSNKTIWPHFHYFAQYTVYNETYWESYKTVNKQFATTILKHLQADDLVWVHDYQLLLVPQLIRTKFPEASIGFFLHIPFPSYEIFRILPWRKELLQGILGADQIGFHTYGYMRHFLSAAYRITGYEHNFGQLQVGNRLINIDVFPMGIDYEKYANPTRDLFKDDGTFGIRQLADNRRLIISIDRLDYTKGIPQRVLAFSRFLKQYPEYIEKVVLILIVVPSRSNVDQYQELKQEIDTMVGEVNGKYRTFDWTPIQYFFRALSFSELTTLYDVADIAMITPLRDGMNLVAKEFIASKETSKQGVLILSEMAGAANELTDALIVNPNDIQGLINALAEALSLNTKDQRWRLEKMQKRLRRYTVRKWANSFIKEQQKLMKAQQNETINPLQKKDRKVLIEAYQSAKKRLIVLDYDGTLMNFQTNPQAVIPDEELMTILQKLQDDTTNKLVVSSGRDKATLDNWLSSIGLDFAAEHGVWIKSHGKWQVAAGLNNNWQPKIREVLESMVERTPGSFIEDKEFSIAWHYRTIDPDLGEKRVREFRDVLLYLTANQDLQVLEGSKVVEIKNAGVNKGKAMVHWLNGETYDFILAIGDDSTDEDTFMALPNEAWTLKVGAKQTEAKYNIASVEEVRSLLQELVT